MNYMLIVIEDETFSVLEPLANLGYWGSPASVPA